MPKLHASSKKNRNSDTPSNSASIAKVLNKHDYIKKIINVDEKDPKRFICTVCSKNQKKTAKKDGIVIGGRFTWLKKHLTTPTHKEFTPQEEMKDLLEAINSLGRSQQGNTAQSAKLEDSNVSDNASETDEETKEIEELPLSKDQEANVYIDLGHFITKNHLPFSIADPLLDFIKEMNLKYEEKLLKRAHISTTTIIKVIRECMGSTLKKSLFDLMRKRPFSILTDQSSDIFGGKYLALLIRYIDSDQEKPITRLLSIIEVENISTGLVLFQKIKEDLLLEEEPIRNNFIGFCTDGESKMISTNNPLSLDKESRIKITKGAGLANRLMKEVNHLVHIRDLCHLYNLIYEDALEEFPVYIVQFIKQVCAYFNKGLRDNALKETQLENGVKKPLSVLGFKEIRWTSLLTSVERILDLWIHIKKYFEEVDNSLGEKFNDPEYHLYSYLLYLLLHKLIGYNIYFQNPYLLYDEIVAKLKEGFLLFSKMVFKKELQDIEFEDAYKIKIEDSGDESYRKSISNFDEFKGNIYQRYPRLEFFVKETIKAYPRRGTLEKECLLHGQDFIIRVISSMKIRLPFLSDVYSKTQVIFLREKICQVSIWRELAAAFPNIITKEEEVKFSEEFDIFELNYKAIYQNHINSEISIIRRWELLSKNYFCISKLAKALLVLPYSSAPVESIFSEFKAFKTPYRNQLSVESLEASILSEQASNLDQKILLSQMIERYPDIWKEKTEPVESPAIINTQAHSNHLEIVLEDKIQPEIQSENIPNIEKDLETQQISSHFREFDSTYC